MKVTFISNYMNHHQLPLCLALRRILGEDFCFIALTEISEARKALGYADMNRSYDFIHTVSDGALSQQEAMQICLSTDILLVGSAPDHWFSQRLKAGNVTIKYSERYFRTGWSPRYFFKDLICAWKHLTRYQRDPLYFLCASAYTKQDVNRFANFQNRTFKWGYFPKVNHYGDIEPIISGKRKNSIIWVARFLELKHPEAALFVAKRLWEEGYDFTLEMVGTGPLLEQTRQQAVALGLADRVCLPGAVSTEEVRKRMEQSQVFIFTSDQNEGWGAVLNEAMSSCCAVVSNRAIGSTPYLIQDGKNGFIYDTQEELYQRVKLLLDDPPLCRMIARSAYRTMAELWSPEVAAERLVALCEALLGGQTPNLFQDGPCSRA